MISSRVRPKCISSEFLCVSAQSSEYSRESRSGANDPRWSVIQWQYGGRQASVLTRRRWGHGGMKRVMKRCRTVSRKPPSPNQANQGSCSHNNLQFAHQLRVLTNYKDINGGGLVANQPQGEGEGIAFTSDPISRRGDLELPTAIISHAAVAYVCSVSTVFSWSLLSIRYYSMRSTWMS